MIDDLPRTATEPVTLLPDARTLLESMTEGVSLSTEDGIIVYTNPAEDEMFGYAPGELIGAHVSIQNAYADDETQRIVADVIDHLRTRGRWEGEWRNRRKDGTVFVTASRITPVEVGGRTHWLCVQRDVTAQREAEEARRTGERRLRAVLEAAPAALFAVDAAWRLTVFNRAAEAFFELRREDVLGRNVWDVFPMTGATIIGEHMRSVMATGRAVSFESNSARHPDRIISARIAPKEGGGLALSLEDITARRHAEAHQALLINELNHRVKNTLAVVQGIAQQTFRGASAAPAAQASFEGRLAALSAAHNVLTRESWRSASLREIVEAAAAPFDPALERFDIEGPEFRLDPKPAVSLALALHELGTNAMKYGALTSPAGRVSVRWTLEAGLLSLIWEEHGGPAVEAPAVRGFGTRMIERVLSAELGGTARIEFRPKGLVCRVDAKLE